MLWPADAVERRKVADLIPSARNARTHSETQISQLAGSIREWGWTTPVLLDEEANIIAGHGRVLAALKLGLDDVPCMTARGWSEHKKRAYMLADNRLAENAGWDNDLLRVELGDLAAAGLDLEALGFDPGDLADLLARRTEGLTDPDDVPALPIDPVSERGDVWRLGAHRLTCGDSTRREDVERVLEGGRAALMLTDPPYGIGDTASPKNDYDLHDDTRPALVALIAAFWPIALEVADRVVLTPGVANLALYPPPTWVLAWFTPAGVGSGPWGFCCWQPCLAYGKDPFLAQGKGRRPDALVHTESAERNGHPCSKPVGFWGWLMERSSDPGDVVLDMFSGSGTSLIAAERLGRVCRAVELSPAYVDLAVRRWEAFTGEAATLEGGEGATFTEMERARHGDTRTNAEGDEASQA